MAEQTSHDPALHEFPILAEAIRGHEVEDDVVVVARIKSDVVAAGFNHGPHDINGLISIERRHLDGHDIFNFGKLPPKRKWQNASADGWLQIEPDDRNNFSNR